jgi:hypothetical protein
VLPSCVAVIGPDGEKRFIHSPKVDSELAMDELRRKLQSGEITIEQFKTRLKAMVPDD